MTHGVVLAMVLMVAELAPSGSDPLSPADGAFSEADFEGALRLLDALVASGEEDEVLARAHLLRAQCFAAIGDYGHAESALVDALRHDPDAKLNSLIVPPPLVALMNDIRTTLQAELTVETDTPGALVLLDGKTLGPAPFKGPVPIGRRTLEVRSPGGSKVRVVLLRPGQAQRVTLTAPVQPRDSAQSSDSGSQLRPYAELRTLFEPGAGGGFELGAGAALGEVFGSLHGVLGSSLGLTLRLGGGASLPVAGLSGFVSADLPLFFVADHPVRGTGGTAVGVGGSLGVRYAAFWVMPFAELSGRYFLMMPEASTQASRANLLLAAGVRVQVP
ncbi:MAG: PEGA domain-containing protein [Myxococcaceae bacterium]